MIIIFKRKLWSYLDPMKPATDDDETKRLNDEKITSLLAPDSLIYARGVYT